MSVTTSNPATMPHLHKGYQLPYFKEGDGRPSPFSASDMNKIVAVCNALLRGEIRRGARDELHISDHKIVWELARNISGANTEPPSASNATGVDDEIRDAAFLGDGRVFIGGAFTKVNGVYRERTAVLNNDLSTDATYFGGIDGPSAPLVTTVSYVNNPPDPFNGDLLSSYWAGGHFTKVGDNTLLYGHLAICDERGDPEGTGFNGGVDITASTYGVLGIQLPGSTGYSSVGMVVGAFSKINNVNSKFIGVVEIDGTLNPSFTLTAFDPTTNGAAINSVWMKEPVGFNNSYPGNSQFYLETYFVTLFGIDVGLILINGDGSLDSSFQPYWSASPNIYDLKLHPSGDGIFLLENGLQNPRSQFVDLIHMDSTGAYVDDFDSGYGNGVSESFDMDSAGRLVIGGAFTEWVHGSTVVTRNSLVRLHTNGSLDNDFNVPITGYTATVRKVLIEPGTDIIYIFGDFSHVGGLARERMARITSMGEVL